MEYLRIGTGLALSWCIGGLALSWRNARRFGPKVYRAKLAGSAGRGVFYALGAGMLPGAKESVRTHVGSWCAGVGYHLGILASTAVLLTALLNLPVHRPAGLALGAAALMGAVCGVGLLLKRASNAHLRSFSVPDDFLSNGLATAFSGISGLTALGFLPVDVTLAGAIALFVYLPLGKIRHCVFFFPTRVHFGTFFGRRGVLPPSGGGAHA